MCVIIQLVSASLNPRLIADHLRKPRMRSVQGTRVECSHFIFVDMLVIVLGFWKSIYCGRSGVLILVSFVAILNYSSMFWLRLKKSTKIPKKQITIKVVLCSNARQSLKCSKQC